MASCCLADLQESFGLAGCARGNSTGSNVLSEGPSMDQAPRIPATHRLLGRDNEGPGRNERYGTTDGSPPVRRQTMVRMVF